MIELSNLRGDGEVGEDAAQHVDGSSCGLDRDETL